MQFSALFSYMLWYIELKFCIWLCFTVLQIKFECRQFASIFVGVMPLLELRILKIHSFRHFSVCRSVCHTPIAMFRRRHMHSSECCRYFYTSVFRRDVLWYGNVRPGLHPSFRPSDSPSVRSLSAHFPLFSPTCFDLLSWNFAHDFVWMNYRSSSTFVTLRQFLKELCLFVNLE